MQSPKLVNGDIVFDDNGDLVMVEGAEEVAQCCEIALGTNINEWFLNPDMGIKFSAFQGKDVSEEEMREQIRHGLFQEPRIKTVESIEFARNEKARTLLIQFVVTTNEGERIENEVKIDA
jgi:hypothetical protein